MNNKRELLELINQLRVTLKQYDTNRQPLTPASRRWAYFFLAITLFLTAPFFMAVFRNEELTKKKVTRVRDAQLELTKLEDKIKAESEPNLADYTKSIYNCLCNLVSDHNDLQRRYNKNQLSKARISILDLRTKPSWLQSGLTLCIDNCLEMVNRFCKKYLPSSTAQVNTMMNTVPQFPRSQPVFPSSAPPYSYNPASVAPESLHRQHSQPGGTLLTHTPGR